MSTEFFNFENAPLISCEPSYLRAKKDIDRMGLQETNNKILKMFYVLNGDQIGLCQTLHLIEAEIQRKIIEQYKTGKISKEEYENALLEFAQGYSPNYLKIETRPIGDSENQDQYTATRQHHKTGEALFSVSFSIETDEKSQSIIRKNSKIRLSKKVATYLGLGEEASVYQYSDVETYLLDDVIRLDSDSKDDVSVCYRDLDHKIRRFPQKSEEIEAYLESLKKCLTDLYQKTSEEDRISPEELKDYFWCVFEKMTSDRCHKPDISHIAIIDDYCEKIIKIIEENSPEDNEEDLYVISVFQSLRDTAREIYPLSLYAQQRQARICSVLDEMMENTQSLTVFFDVESLKNEIQKFFNNRLYCNEKIVHKAIESIRQKIADLIQDMNKNKMFIPVELSSEYILKILERTKEEYLTSSNYFTADFLKNNASIIEEIKTAWAGFIADPSDEKIATLLSSFHPIYDVLPQLFKNDRDTLIFAFSSILKEIVGNDASIQMCVDIIKRALDKKIDDVVALDSVALAALLKIKDKDSLTSNFNTLWEEEKNTLIEMIEELDPQRQITEIYKNEVKDKMNQLASSFEQAAENIQNEKDQDKIKDAITHAEEQNKEFIHTLKVKLSSFYPKNKTEIHNKFNVCLERLNAKSERPFVDKAIDNINKAGDEHYADAKKQSGQEKADSCKKAIVNKKLACDLMKQSNNFYKEIGVTSNDGIKDKLNTFSVEFRQTIEKSEADEISDNLWKPIFDSLSRNLNEIGFSSAASVVDSISHFIFGSTKYEIAKKVVKTISEEFKDLPKPLTVM